MTRRKNVYRSIARFHEAERLSAANALADPEEVLRFLDAVWIAEKLESYAALALFQNDSEKTELVTLQTLQNIVFGLANKIPLKPARPETYL